MIASNRFEAGKSAVVVRATCLLVGFFALGPLAPGRAAEGIDSQIKEVSEGVYAIGTITIRATDHEIHFPAELNMETGVIEYALVHEKGKVHESLLGAKVSPMDVNVALLLAKPKSDGAVNVRVFIRLSDDAPEMPIEKWIRKSDADAVMSSGPWIYQGSRIEEGVFVAERDGSMISIIKDADSLVGNPREGSENDDIWEVMKSEVPKIGTPVDVVIRFESR